MTSAPKGADQREGSPFYLYALILRDAKRVLPWSESMHDGNFLSASYRPGLCEEVNFENPGS
jgi:hypothetical protein